MGDIIEMLRSAETAWQIERARRRSEAWRWLGLACAYAAALIVAVIAAGFGGAAVFELWFRAWEMGQ